MMEFVFDKVKTFVGKGENAADLHFLLFPPCLGRLLHQGRLKLGLNDEGLTSLHDIDSLPNVRVLDQIENICRWQNKNN